MNRPLPLRILHFDMKALIPRADFMIRLLPEIASMNYNAILLELEDKFPYRSMPEIVHPDAWSRTEFAAFREAAAANGIEIIPLLQCAGHLDYILKHEEYRHLREGNPPRDATNEWCLADTAQPMEIFQKLSTEILEVFPDCRYFHIGADEYDCNHPCSRCGDRDRHELFVDHVSECNAFIRNTGRKVVVWDDMFRKRDSEKMRQLLRDSVPCVWQYIGVDESLVSRMCSLSKEVWGASKIQANPKCRGLGPQDAVMDNVDAWSAVHEKYPLTGHVATIWGRNHGLSALAQTLPEAFYMMGYQAEALSHGIVSDRTAFRKSFAKEYFGLPDMPWIDDIGYRPEKAAAGLVAALKSATRNQEILTIWETFNSIDQLWEYCDTCFGNDMAHYPAYITGMASDDITFNFKDGTKITKERAEALRHTIGEALCPFFTPALLEEYLASRLEGLLAVNEFWRKHIEDAITSKRI